MTRSPDVWTRVCDDTPPASAPAEDASAPVAVIVTHGMGQPVPFQTLEEVVHALREAESRAGRPRPDVCVRRVELMVDKQLEPFNRAELWIGPEPGEDLSGGPRGREVHLYEVYWAPIPEGKVTGGDVIRFLLGALWHNRRISGAKFHRYLFGEMRDYEIRPGRVRFLLFSVGIVLLSLLFINVAIGLVTLVGLFNGALANEWLTRSLLITLLRDVGFLLVPILFLLLGMVFVPRWTKPPSGEDPRKPKFHKRNLLAWSFIVVAGIALVVIAGLIGWDMANHLKQAASDEPGKGLVAWFGLVWLILLGLTRFVRDVLVQYVGDVAAYISAHTVNRFWQIRTEIFQTATRVARAVYGAPGKADRPLYGEVVVVGHSHGSLIAYDMLNGVLLEDYLAERAAAAEVRKPLGVAGRTSALVTTGSPLDKVAFLFRILRPLDSIVREVLSNAIQPLIMHRGFRPRRWINIFSWNDLIAGDLDYFDPPGADLGRQGMVENLYDHAAHRPLLAHTQYWGNALFGDVLLQVLGVGARRPSQGSDAP